MRPNRLIVCLCLVLVACHKHVPVLALPPAPAPVSSSTPSASTPTPMPAPTPNAPPLSPLNRADRAFIAGNYDEAARGYEDYLSANTTGTLRDQALFYLGLSVVLRPAPPADWTRATEALKELVNKHPKSPFKDPASVILSLHSELDQLTADSKQRDARLKQLATELERLKRIDAERRK
jgi:hypothetical protein